MKALLNAYSQSVPSDIVIEYIKLYKKVGYSDLYFEELKKEYRVHRRLAEKDDIYHLFQAFYKGNKVSQTRFSSLVSEKASFSPKNNDENIIVNLKQVFFMIYNSNNNSLIANDIIDLSKIIFANIGGNKSELKKSNKFEDSYRSRLEKMIETYYKLKKEKKIEFNYLNLCFLVDFLKLSPFKEGNDLIAIILYYVLSITSDIKAFAYISFFKYFFKYHQEYEKALSIAFYNYDNGYPQLSELLRLMIKIDNEVQDELKELYRNHDFDKSSKKVDSVIQIIYKLDEQFSKDMIRKALPNVSVSTIDRALKNLQDENKIRAYGRGRNAQWLRLDHSRDERIEFNSNFSD